MEKYITDERTGLTYKRVGDYYLIAGDDDPKQVPIGVWGQRHRRYLLDHKHAIYSGLFYSQKLNGYLQNIDRQAEEMFSQLVSQMDAEADITEELKTSDQMAWVGAMNCVRQQAMEIVTKEFCCPVL